ncbi:zinc metalloprotease, partial [mine drainage metagenome]
SITYCAPSFLGVNYGNLISGSRSSSRRSPTSSPPSLVSLHPLALAGWFGVFLTAINLLPAGQLDGGHVFRALFGDRARFVSYGAIALMVGLSIFYLGWLLFALLVFIFGARHPPPLNDLVRLDVKRYALGAAAVAILLTGIALVPLAVPAGTVSLSDSGLTPLPSPPSWAQVAANLSVTV